MHQPKTTACLRVSTTDQDMEKNKIDILKLGNSIEALLANGSKQKFIAKRYGTTEANLSRWIKKHRIKRVMMH